MWTILIESLIDQAHVWLGLRLGLGGVVFFLFIILFVLWINNVTPIVSLALLPL